MRRYTGNWIQNDPEKLFHFACFYLDRSLRNEDSGQLQFLPRNFYNLENSLWLINSMKIDSSTNLHLNITIFLNMMFENNSWDAWRPPFLPLAMVYYDVSVFHFISLFGLSQTKPKHLFPLCPHEMAVDK